MHTILDMDSTVAYVQLSPLEMHIIFKRQNHQLPYDRYQERQYSIPSETLHYHLTYFHVFPYFLEMQQMFDVMTFNNISHFEFILPSYALGKK